MANTDWLANKRIIVLGLGASGQSCARWLTKQGFPFIWLDSRETPPALAQCRALFPDVEIQTGEFNSDLLCQADFLFVSPGIAPTEPALAAAIRQGVDLLGDVELFCRIVDKPVIAVTGSNGKSTVVTFTGELLNASGIHAVVAGNIGLPVLDALEKNADCYVLELSSFQLMSTHSLRDHVGCILNISEDHLDWHGSMQDYIAAKQKIYTNAKTVVFNQADGATFPNPQQLAFSVATTAPTSDLEFGIHNQWLCRGNYPIVAIEDCPLQETHNLFNLLAAIALCAAVDVDVRKLTGAIKSLSGLAHRCELVKSLKGVSWYNDSKATNVGATLAAIDSLQAGLTGKMWLIAGGDGKGADFTDLRRRIHDNQIGLITLGKDGDAIALGCDSVIKVDTLESAVTQAAALAVHGDIVLLSPACASLDMFRNYIERGERFVKAVEGLQ